jgi:YfiH family protein
MTQESNFKNYILANWQAPNGIKAFSTTRRDESECTQYGCFNLAHHVNDERQNVDHNRQKLIEELSLPSSPFWLEQNHSTKVVEYSQQHLTNSLKADASYTGSLEQVCIVMTADCLPILFCNKQGTWVAATHAGWKGLLHGIVENTIRKYKERPSDLMVWLGPAISQKYFEVGDEVKQQFIAVNPLYRQAFIASNKGKCWCDLYLIARLILKPFQIEVFGGEHCTYNESDTFYSYRRDGETGRMASLIWIDKEELKKSENNNK